MLIEVLINYIHDKHDQVNSEILVFKTNWKSIYLNTGIQNKSILNIGIQNKSVSNKSILNKMINKKQTNKAVESIQWKLFLNDFDIWTY
jgi:hypothetical protein